MRFLGLVTLSVAYSLSNAAWAADCIVAGSEANVSGALAQESSAYVLTIGSPACLKGEEGPDNVAPTTRLQVFPATEDVQKSLEGLVGKTISIKGSFYGSMSKKLNAPILVEVSAAAAQ